MTGWILYDEAGARRNSWFIQSFIKSAKTHGVELVLKIMEREENLFAGPLPDFAMVRTIQPELNWKLEELGVSVFNNFKTSQIANDKWLTYGLCQKLGIPTMKTRLLSEDPQLDFPFVMKSLNGHGGAEVFLIRDERELQARLERLDQNRFLMQEFCSAPGQDMRVYVLGGEIIAGILRTSDTDFRSNFSLGGNVTVCDVKPEQEEIIRLLHKELDFDFVGIDFIRHHGKWVLNEIEDVVGSRMLYQCTDIDIIDLYMGYIVRRVAPQG